MHVHVLQHVPFEGLGSIHAWLDSHDARVTWTRLFESADFPAPDAPDLVIALGGPMSVNDETEHPWLVAEKHFIHDAIAAGTPMLGICLGAQLIANTHGARVYPGAEPEIGWFPIQGEAASGDGFSLPAETLAFHWHGETFDLPPGATRLAHSDGCANQAFQLGTSVIGVQFHLETTPDSAAALLDNCADELEPGRPFIQDADHLRAVPADAYARINALMATMLDYLIRKQVTTAG